MLEQSVDRQVGSDQYRGRGAYLSSHRALSALTREFVRLGDEIVAGAGTLTLPEGSGKPDARRSPERLIFQFGPVAVTLGWLRSTLDSVGDGKLLVALWQGTIAGRRSPSPERPSAAPQQTASIFWERTLIAQATSEETWVWAPEDGSGTSYSSTELAAECVRQLKLALK